MTGVSDDSAEINGHRDAALAEKAPIGGSFCGNSSSLTQLLIKEKVVDFETHGGVNMSWWHY